MIAQPSSFHGEDHPARRDIAELEDRLYEYNARRTGIDDGRWLTIFVPDDAKAIVAGLHGWTWGDCFYVQTLWVREHLLGQGPGPRLMRAAEAEAVSRGCGRALLSPEARFVDRGARRLMGAVACAENVSRSSPLRSVGGRP